MEEGPRDIESPCKTPVFNESPRKGVFRNGIEVPNLDTGAIDGDGISPRAPIRTDVEVSPLQLASKEKSKQRQQKMQEEKEALAGAASGKKEVRTNG